MNEFLTFAIAGIVTGSVYALASSGLVVTYTTTGVFNFAHGAVGMIAAFTYWQLRVAYGWPAPVALVLVIGVLAPLFGALVERFLIRPLKDMSLATSLVVTIGLMVGLMGLAEVVWPTGNRELPILFGTDHKVMVGHLNVYWNDITIVVLAVLVAVALRFLLFRTRIGLAMRAQVDNRDLTALNGVHLDRVSMLSWALGFSLAALAGILLAPTLQLSVTTLTLLVVDAYAAAMFGRLKSLPLTYLGAILLGLAGSFASYLPANSFFSNLRDALPTLVLFGVLLAMPGSRIRVGSLVRSAASRAPSVRASVVGGAVVVVAAALVLRVLDHSYVQLTDDALATAIIMCSLVLLTGLGGQVSLCQMTFAGIGAYAVVHFRLGGAGGIVAIAAAGVLAGIVGLVVALPAIRLQGLYLALGTMAFAVLAQDLFFNSSVSFGTSGAASIARFHLGSLLTFHSDRAYGVFLAVCFAATAVAVAAIRSSWMGRRLAAMRDSPAASATLGMNLALTKLAVFGAAAAIAGIGGALLGGVLQSVSSSEGVNTGYDVFQSLALLVLVVIGGISTTTGALIGGFSMWVAVTFAQNHVRGILFPAGFALAVYVILRSWQTPQPVSLTPPNLPLASLLARRWTSLGERGRAAVAATFGGLAVIAVFLVLDHEASKLQSGLLYLSSGGVAVTLAQYPDGVAPAIAAMVRTTVAGLGLGRLLDLVGLGRMQTSDSAPQPLTPPGPRFDDFRVDPVEAALDSEELLVAEVPLTLGPPYEAEEGVLQARDPLAGSLAGTDAHDSDLELGERLALIIRKARISHA
jgi:branched-chain amino acid transport system permease protein